MGEDHPFGIACRTSFCTLCHSSHLLAIAFSRARLAKRAAIFSSRLRKQPFSSSLYRSFRKTGEDCAQTVRRRSVGILNNKAWRVDMCRRGGWHSGSLADERRGSVA